MTVSNVLLSGVVGSTAYGLAHAGSDVDLLGMFAAPTAAFHGLHSPQETITTTHPDTTYHEAAKWLRLALGGNPTVMELVWLNTYEIKTRLGEEIIEIRGSLLSAKRVRDAYLGYATQQFRRLESRDDGTFSADTRKRTAKHARHLWRLLYQGTELHRTGQLRVKLDSEHASSCLTFGESVAAGNRDIAEEALRKAEDVFNTAGVLPDQANEIIADMWLQRVRREFLTS